MGIAGYLGMPVIASVDALLNGSATGTRAFASRFGSFVWASLMTMLTESALFFGEMFTG
jgi:hypothetical protein